MFCFMRVLYLFLVILLEFKESEGAGVIEIKFIEYVNTNGFKTGNPSQCCDVPSSTPSQCKADPCDPIFDICLQNISSSGCEFGRQTTGYVANSNMITFNKSIGANNTNNPLRFPVSEFFHNQVILTLTVYDEDRLAGSATNDKIDYMQQVVFFTPDVNGTRSTVLHYNLTGVSSSLSVEMNIRCGTFYFGTSCKKRCRPNKPSQTCRSDGSKGCLPGYTGVQCGTNIDDCVGHICQNGATCQDGVNNYTCKCMSDFTGRYCETIITTSTLPTTTTSTSTTVTTATTSALPTTTTSTTVTTSATSTSPTTTTSSTLTTSATSTSPTTTSSASLTTSTLSTTIETTTASSSSTPSTTLPTTTTSLPASSLSTTTQYITATKSLPATTKLFSKTSTLQPTTSISSPLPKASSSAVASKSSSTATTAPSISTKSSTSSIKTPKPTLTTPSSFITSTPSSIKLRLRCIILDMVLKSSPGNVALSLNVSGTFTFEDFRNYLQKWSQQQMKLHAKTVLKSNNILGSVRQLVVDIQFPRTSHLINVTEKLKNAIKTFCNPHASMFGKNKMPEPAQSGSSPGPVIGGVFGGLAAAAVATTAGFLIYKRKFKPTPNDSDVQTKKLTKTEKDAVSNETSGDRADGKSLTETDVIQKETQIHMGDTVKEPKTVRHLNLGDGMKILDF